MEIFVNGEKKIVKANEVNVSELLSHLKIEMPEMVTVELNNNIVSKDAYLSQIVKEGDAIEFLYFMGGGA